MVSQCVSSSGDVKARGLGSKAVNSRRRLALAVGLFLLFAGAAVTRRLEPTVAMEALSLDGLDGAAIPALRIHPRDSGRIRGHALLLHGVTASKETMVPFAEALALDGLDCLAVDFPGHGESTEAFGDRAALTATAVAAARFVSPGRPLDAVVGHSMGAYVAAEALAAGQLHARRFVSLGAASDPGPGPGSALFLAGRWDELVSGAALAQLALAGPGRRSARSVFSDHVLEPFDPLLIAEAVPGAAARTAWLIRLLGIASLGLGFLLALWAATPVVTGRGSRLGLGLLAFLATMLTYTVGFGGVWLSAWPTLGRLPVAAVLGVVSAVGLGVLTALVSLLPLLRRWPATAALALTMLALIPALGLLLVVRQNFLAMCVGWCVLLFAALVVLAGIVEHRSRSPLAAVVCTAAFLGYFFGQWIPVQ
jgi:pimeloyl-ACP methyl ester carboxylesterase